MAPLCLLPLPPLICFMVIEQVSGLAWCLGAWLGRKQTQCQSSWCQAGPVSVWHLILLTSLLLPMSLPPLGRIGSRQLGLGTGTRWV